MRSLQHNITQQPGILLIEVNLFQRNEMVPWRWTPRHGQGSETFQQLGCGKVVDDIQSKCGPLKGSRPVRAFTNLSS